MNNKMAFFRFCLPNRAKPTSILSEQAARLLSMDNSTRGAEGLLEINKLHYNKLLQADIAK